ncbi:hypothetical protein DND132_1736 [Pseudodesulfovibrio mercurii]|uniref:RiboL-PSP-HEPN domain-containing protein n=1 Tax=Pseudodesulfovibrio mercurii TaxID=641491 RepID=F0JFL8_9BACT|nr:MAE_28990/MAE_18760 family HEPN-like nuclease [Pseudodesulfovibrio mercurii]EGB14942.1 hypothetical protein DND132_1736 [Pseudodesulfovibrio mercurii]
MKIRSLEELINCLAANSAKRKKELITHKSLISDGRVGFRQFFFRSSVVFAYAHWEGFIKHSAMSYLTYLTHLKPAVSDMTDNFHAICCKNKINTSVLATKRIAPHLDLIRFYKSEVLEGLKYSEAPAIDTESNLNSDVFENICSIIGMEYSEHWSQRAPFINELVMNRCAIAHGELIDIPQRYAIEVVDFVYSSIDRFGADIENTAVQQLYLRAKYDKYKGIRP